MTSQLSNNQRLKFKLLSDGLAISDGARSFIDTANQGRDLTPADYASTSGVILRLDEDVWVNAPIVDHNANFVATPECTLDVDGDGLVLRTPMSVVSAEFWLAPAYHGRCNHEGEAYNSYAFTHADRVRISPVEGCAFTCRFCDLPYDFKYRTKRLAGLRDSVKVALTDPVQPARHVLISGGVPRAADYEYLVESYEMILTSFPDVDIDIMMVPLPEIVRLRSLAELGVHELSINVEIFNTDLARKLMRRKSDQGVQHYLDFLSEAADVLGGDRVRSMLLVGIEPMEDTLAGVTAIAERGCVPVLSPFRPDPSTPLASAAIPTAAFIEEVYVRSVDIASRYGVALGPSCAPCSHNTLTFPAAGGAHSRHDLAVALV
jgi:hypothetical protein